MVRLVSGAICPKGIDGAEQVAAGHAKWHSRYAVRLENGSTFRPRRMRPCSSSAESRWPASCLPALRIKSTGVPSRSSVISRQDFRDAGVEGYRSAVENGRRTARHRCRSPACCMTGSSPPSQRAEAISIESLYRWALRSMQASRGTSEHHEPRRFPARCRQHLAR